MAETQGLLDTSILIDILLDKSDAKTWLDAFWEQGQQLSIVSISRMEALAGAQNKQEMGQFGRILARFDLKFFTSYIRIRSGQ